MAIDPSLFQRMSSLFSRIFYSKDKKQQQARVDPLFNKKDPSNKWDKFKKNVGDKEYLESIKRDPRSDSKLKQHAESMHNLENGKNIGTVLGSKGTSYQIKKLSGGDIGCTCRDWRYRRSVAPPGQRDCVHIREFKRRQT